MRKANLKPRRFNAVLWTGIIHDLSERQQDAWVSEKMFNKADNPENLKQKIDGQHSNPCLPRIHLDMKKI